MSEHPFDRLTEAGLRRRQSAKWRAYPDDVLPAWVAEMDYPIAEPITRTLQAALTDDDLGYADPRGLGEAFAPWARETWGWTLSPSDVRVAPDVVTAIGEILHVATEPGDGVVIDPPVYPPFAGTIQRLHRKVVEAPLLRSADGPWSLDLAAIERAYAAGARVHLLCSPQNPTGIAHPRETLARVAEL
ncbi:MAG: putative aminotransferase, partial [Labilithrix sp.]|nr:putative aminotransferase [Labilithrix sp.]